MMSRVKQGIFAGFIATVVVSVLELVNLLFAKLKAGDDAAAYAYSADPDCRWDSLNIEQQAMVMEHRFHGLRGGETPGTRAFYDAVCPFVR